MYSGKGEHIKLRTSESMMDMLIDFFGKDFRISYGEDEDIIVDVKCNPDAFFFWVMQFGSNTEVLEPESMRERIKQAYLNLYNRYK